MRKNISLALILSSAMALTTAAVAAPSGQDSAAGHHGGHSHDRGHRHGRHHGHDMMNFKKLNLTDAQRATIRQIYKNSFAQNKPQREALHKQREAFRTMTPDQVGYQSAASRLAQAEGSATQQRVQQRADVRAQVYAVLTSTQKAQLATLRSAHQERRQQWKQFKAAHPVSAASTSADQ